jgi:NADH-quinone oxidoreductase subunit C
MNIQEIENILNRELAFNPILGRDEQSQPPVLKIDPAQLLSVCKVLHANPAFYFDTLSCLSGIDNGPEGNTLEVLYHLYSIPHHYSLGISCLLPRNTQGQNLPEIDSVCSVWKSANWHEREAYEMVGIRFKGHPDLRNLLLPADWEGYPLRKDYQQQDSYRGIKVEY